MGLLKNRSNGSVGTIIWAIIFFSCIFFSKESYAALFTIGDRVQVSGTGGIGLTVRTAPPDLIKTDAVPEGAQGTITNGPQVATLDGTSYTWWEIQWDNGVSGWSVGNFIINITVISPSSFELSANAYCNTTPPEAPAIMLTWSTSNGATSYDLYRNDNLYSSGITGTTFDNNLNVTAGQSYTYYVVARNSTGTTQSSNTVTVSVPSDICPTPTTTQPPILSPPTHISPSNGATNISLSPTFQWNGVSGAICYGLYISEPPYGLSNLVFDSDLEVPGGCVRGTSFTLAAGSLINGVPYLWNMVSWNSVNVNGSFSSAWSFTTSPTLPPPPAPTSTPDITSISPNPVIGSDSRQWITINGSNFIAGLVVTLRTGSEIFTIPPDRTRFIHSSLAQVFVNVTTMSATWTAEVRNPDGGTSSPFSFSVVAPTQPPTPLPIFTPTPPTGQFSVTQHLMTDTKEINNCIPPSQKTTFLDTDSFAVIWFSYENADRGDVFKWEWFHDGIFYTKTDVTVNNVNSCWNHFISINGTSAASFPGQWQVTLYRNNEPIFTENFLIISDPDKTFIVTEHLMTDITSEEFHGTYDNCAIPPEKSEFMDTDEFVAVWFQVINANSGDKYKLEWYQPDGKLYWTREDTSDLFNFCRKRSISINGSSAASFPGQWQVIMYRNNEPIFTENFTIMATATFSIAGSITDSMGKGLSNIEVNLSDTTSKSAITSSNGNYIFEGLSNGNYTITPQSSTWTFLPTSIKVNINGTDVSGQNFIGNTTDVIVSWESPPPPNLEGGQKFDALWMITGGINVGHTNIHWDTIDPTDSNRCNTSNNPPCSNNAQSGTPGLFTDTAITAPDISQTTTYRYVAHAIVDDEVFWSNIVSSTVSPRQIKTIQLRAPWDEGQYWVPQTYDTHLLSTRYPSGWDSARRAVDFYFPTSQAPNVSGVTEESSDQSRFKNIRAAHAGIAEWANKPCNGVDSLDILSNDGTYKTQYIHVNVDSNIIGKTVTAGQIIGTVDRVGCIEGWSHFMFVVGRKNGSTWDAVPLDDANSVLLDSETVFTSSRQIINNTATHGNIYRDSSMPRTNTPSPPPAPPSVIADFSASPTKGTLDAIGGTLVVKFNDTSQPSAGAQIISWDWDFGDNTAITKETNPLHEYNMPGQFTISLEVTDSNADTDLETKVDYIEVIRESIIPTINLFSINDGDAVTSDRTVTLNNNCSGNPTHYIAGEDFNFNSAIWQDYSTKPEFTLSAGDETKEVYFKVRNTIGESLDVRSDTIILDETDNKPPIAKFTMSSNGETVSEGGTLNLTVPDGSSAVLVQFSSIDSNDSDGEIESHEWKWEESNIVFSSEREFSEQVGIGTYNFTLTVIDDDSLSDSVNGTIKVELKETESLLEKYAPILYLHPDEQFFPVPIEAFLRESTLIIPDIQAPQLVREINNPSVDDLMTGIYLDLNNADPGIKENKRFSTVPNPNDWNNVNPAVYGRLVKEESTNSEQSTILQYWFFYVFNDYGDFEHSTAEVLRHEGDWEMIQVILNKNESPTATYSYHRGGIHYDWDNANEEDSVLFDPSDINKTHPKVFVAHGGHGSWNRPDSISWEQDVFTINCDTEHLDITSDKGTVLYPESFNKGTTYSLIDISDATTSNDWRWVHWLGRWGEIEPAGTSVGTAGPESPAIINYINPGNTDNNRWNDPLGWDNDPLPATYKACNANRTSPTTLYVYNSQGKVIETYEMEAQNPISVFTDEDLIFEICPIEDGEVDFSITRYSRKEKRHITAYFKDIYLSVKDKAILPFAEYNPELYLSIERNQSGTINEWIRPHILDKKLLKTTKRSGKY